MRVCQSSHFEYVGLSPVPVVCRFGQVDSIPDIIGPASFGRVLRDRSFDIMIQEVGPSEALRALHSNLVLTGGNSRILPEEQHDCATTDAILGNERLRSEIPWA